jgi:hypothetical protein
MALKPWIYRHLIRRGRVAVQVLRALVIMLMTTVLYLMHASWWQGLVVGALVLASMAFGLSVAVNQVVRDAQPDE